MCVLDLKKMHKNRFQSNIKILSMKLLYLVYSSTVLMFEQATLNHYHHHKNTRRDKVQTQYISEQDRQKSYTMNLTWKHRSRSSWWCCLFCWGLKSATLRMQTLCAGLPIGTRFIYVNRRDSLCCKHECRLKKRCKETFKQLVYDGGSGSYNTHKKSVIIKMYTTLKFKSVTLNQSSRLC